MKKIITSTEEWMSDILLELSELWTSERKEIIQNLGKNINDLPEKLEKLPTDIKNNILYIFEKTSNDKSLIPTVRYELEEYSNDLNPDFSEKFIEKNRWKTVKILDVWAWPWDVTIRSYEKLIESWINPIVFAVEWSSKFVDKILKQTGLKWIDWKELTPDELNDLKWINWWIYPIKFDAREIGRLWFEWLDLVTWNYILDRLPQKKLSNGINSLWVENVQFTNCVPLQYENPETGQKYIPENEIIIPEWSNDLSAIWEKMWLSKNENFFWKNTITSLQDWEEQFDYAWIRGNK